jgi:hypothetical protein
MASGMLTKQAIFQTAKFLNDVNDAAVGGAIVSLPSGAPSPAVSQDIAGDRICLDDATALALSDTAVGTLYGGVYMYVGTLSTSTASPARGTIAFYQATDLGSGATPQYRVTADALPTTAVPAYIAGIFINAITKGNWGWIQVAGLASVLFDSAITAAATGSTVSAKVSAAVASTADTGVVLSTTTLAFVIGVSIGVPVISTISPVLLTRGLFMGRI